LLLIGDAPGAAEDRAGTPFAGPGGAYLDRMLASIALTREQLLLTSLIPWRPPGDGSGGRPTMEFQRTEIPDVILIKPRVFRDDPGASLPVYSVPGALDAVLALDRPGLLDTAVDVRAFEPGAPALVGPFEVSTFALPHSVPNVGMRIAADAAVLAYTGDCGPSDDLLRLAEGAEMLLAESSYAIDVPADAARHLSSAAASGLLARHADVGALVLTHLLPETPSELALDAARERFAGPLRVAAPGLTLDIR